MAAKRSFQEMSNTDYYSDGDEDQVGDDEDVNPNEHHDQHGAPGDNIEPEVPIVPDRRAGHGEHRDDREDEHVHDPDSDDLLRGVPDVEVVDEQQFQYGKKIFFFEKKFCCYHFIINTSIVAIGKKNPQKVIYKFCFLIEIFPRYNFSKFNLSHNKYF